MITRYSRSEVSLLTTDEAKYEGWLTVELAVLKARVFMGTLEEQVYQRIANQAKFSCQRISEIEEDTRHDLLAFVQCVQESLDQDLRKYFHEYMTSYDTEEPATALMFINLLDIIIIATESLGQALKSRAVECKHLIKIHRTHGQHAQPTTLGLELLWWYDAIERALEKLLLVREDMRETKISGGVGTYGKGLNPELEKIALSILQLKPAAISAQIILRDRHARVLNELSVLSSILEHIAINIRLYGQTEIREIQEPFGKNQKGSSYMPHKKNTILTENVCGMASLVRNYGSSLMEKIPTWGARDIAHSSIERVAVVDSFQLTNFMLRRLENVIKGMIVNESQIQKNLDLTGGAIFSPDVKDLLMHEGVDPELAYRICQDAAFKVMDSGVNYFSAISEDSRVPEILKESKKLENVFSFEETLPYVGETFAKFSL
jgi:adenylosuccinate lyase